MHGSFAASGIDIRIAAPIEPALAMVDFDKSPASGGSFTRSSYLEQLASLRRLHAGDYRNG
jgi:hypothetical protein